MDLSRTRIVLRERALVDVFDLALRFVVEHGAVYAKTALVVLPPFFVASVFIARAGGWIATWTFALFTVGFAVAPFTVLASRLVFEDDTGSLSAIKQALRAVHRIFALRVATILGGALGLLALLFPGAFVFVVTLFVVEVALLERASTSTAIFRSMRMVGRESGEAVMAVLVLSLLYGVAVLAADSGGRAIIAVLLESRAPAPMWSEGLGWSYLSLLGFWLFVPYAATARFFVYLDVRTRSEGWDIQTRFTAIATRPLTRGPGQAASTSRSAA